MIEDDVRAVAWTLAEAAKQDAASRGMPTTDEAWPLSVDHQKPHARDAIAALETRGWQRREWQPIETAPTDGTPVLAHFWSRFYEVGAVTNTTIEEASRRYVSAPDGTLGQFTHWMPLPNLPARPDCHQP